MIVERGEGEHPPPDVVEPSARVFGRGLTHVPLQCADDHLVAVAGAVVMLAQQQLARLLCRLQIRRAPHPLDRIGDDLGDAGEEAQIQDVEIARLGGVHLQHAVVAGQSDDRHVSRGHHAV